MKALIAFLMLFICNFAFGSNASINASSRFDDQRKTAVYLLILQKPLADGKDIMCVSEDYYGPSNYAGLALAGLIASEEFIKAYQANPKWHDKYKISGSMLWKGPAFLKSFPRSDLENIAIYK